MILAASRRNALDGRRSLFSRKGRKGAKLAKKSKHQSGPLLSERILEGGDFGEPTLVTFGAGEVGSYVVADYFDGEFGSDDARSEAEDVDVVVFHALAGGETVVAGGGANAFEFVGCHAGSGSTATDEDGTLGLFVEDGEGYGLRVIRVIDGFGGVGTEVGYVVSLFAQLFHYAGFERDARMV